MDRGVRSRQPRAAAALHRGDRRGARRQRFIPPAAVDIDLDSWMATFDSVLTRDSNGHHGRLGRRRATATASTISTSRSRPAFPTGSTGTAATATFEDITDRAGVGVLDDTAQSLFADVDNDGDRGSRRSAVGAKPAALPERRHGTLHAGPRRLPLRRGRCRASLTSIAMADYDRDGYPRSLSVRLLVLLRRRRGQSRARRCRYHDARNGPPGVLFRNDGHGRFVDASRTTPASTLETIAITSRRRGPTTTATAGRTCWSRNDFGDQEPLSQPRSRATAAVTLRGRRRTGGRRSTTAPA